VAGELKNGDEEREMGERGRYQQCLAKENTHTHTLGYKMAHVALPTKLI